METFLEMLHESPRGMLRDTGAYFFRKKVLENRKTTQRWFLEIIKVDNQHPDGEVVWRSVELFLISKEEKGH